MPACDEDKAYRCYLDGENFAIIEQLSYGSNYVVLNLETFTASRVTLNEEHPDVMVCLNAPPGEDCIHVRVLRHYFKLLHRQWEKPLVYDFEAMTLSSKLVVTPETMTEQELDFLDRDSEAHPYHYSSWVKDSVTQERERRKRDGLQQKVQ